MISYSIGRLARDVRSRVRLSKSISFMVSLFIMVLFSFSGLGALGVDRVLVVDWGSSVKHCGEMGGSSLPCTIFFAVQNRASVTLHQLSPPPRGGGG